jgi:hypothetical protein
MITNPFVIPGRARGANPESSSEKSLRCSGFRVRSLRSRPGMTAAPNAALTRPHAGDGMHGNNKRLREEMP